MKKAWLAIIALALIAVLVSCPKPMDPVEDVIPTGFARIKGKLTLPSSVNTSVNSAEVYILGQRQYKTTTNEKGEYTLLVDTRVDGIAAKSLAISKAGTGVGGLLSGGFALVSLTQNAEYGSKTDNVPVNAGQDSLLPPITIERVGSITGRVLLEGGADPSGIDIYIPGTSFMAKADGNGNFSISKVPVGEYVYIRAEKNGYAPRYWTNTKVIPDTATTVAPSQLSVSTGVSGEIIIAGGAEYSRSRTVNVTVRYSADALLMQVSEDPDFVNAKWIFVQDSIEYTFSSDGNKKLYARFADSNALITTFMDSIAIVQDPKPTELYPNSVLGEVRPTLRWDASLLPEQTYEIQIATDPVFQNIFEDRKNLSLNSVKTDTPLSNGTTYYWRVRAVDTAGNPGSWVVEDFRIDISIPRLKAPTYDEIVNNSKPVLSWESDIENLRYIVEISEKSDFSTILDQGQGIASTTYIPTITLKTDTVYFWRVAVQGESGVRGEWGGPFAFRMLLPPVSLIEPISNNKISSRTPLFSWTSHERAKDYLLQVSSNGDFSSLTLNKSGITMQYYKPIETFFTGSSTYYWRVAYRDINGCVSTWSEIREFTIEPYTISNLSPSGNINDSLPVLEWIGSYLGSQTYWLQFSDSKEFSNIIEEKNNLTTSSYRLSKNILNNKKYYWRVRAIAEDQSMGPWSSVIEISLDYGSVVLVDPPDEANISSRQPIFKWDSNPKAATYRIQIDEDPLFESPEIDKNRIGVLSYLSDIELKGNSSYYWRISYSDTAGTESNWSPRRKIYIVPYEISQVEPIGNPGTSKPFFEWTDSYLAGESYWLQISDTLSFSKFILNEQGIVGTNYQPDIGLLDGKNYFWRIKAVAKDGDEGPWSTIKQIKLEYSPISLALPAQDTVFSNRSPQFSWEAHEKASTYRLQIDDDILFLSPEMDKTNIGLNTIISPSELPGGREYYWRVLFVDENGISGPWSEKRKFIVQPYTVNVLSPFGNPGTSRPLFTWTDAYLSNETYEINIASDDRFENIVYQKNNIGGTSLRIDTSLSNRTTYYWRVRALASDGDIGPWSSFGQIYLEYNAPYPNTPFHGEVVYTATPAFNWNSIAWASKYRLLVSQSSNFASTLIDTTINTREYLTDTILPDNCTLYWKVQAIDEFDMPGDWSETRLFTLPPHTLSMGINIKLPTSSVSARLAGDGTYYMPLGGTIEVRIDNYWDFSSYEWAIDGVPIRDSNGNKISGYSCVIANLPKGKFNLSLVAMRNGVPYDTQAFIVVQ